MNLNKFARLITLKEGKKISFTIAQVKEIIRLTLIALGKLSDKKLQDTLNRYRTVSKIR